MAHECCAWLEKGGVVEVRANGSLEVRTRLILSDARDLPAIRHAFYEPIGIGYCRKLIDIGSVENVRAIVGQRSVVVPKVRRIASCGTAFAADSERLAERVIGQECEVSGLLIPCHLQAVVIGIHLMVNNF